MYIEEESLGCWTVENRELAFTDSRIMDTDDIEVLRDAYVQLLRVYQGEIRDRVLLEMRLEELERTVKV